VGNRKAARNVNVDESCIRRWRKQRHEIIGNKRTHLESEYENERRLTRESEATWLVLKAELSQWITQKTTKKNLKLTPAVVLLQAQIIAIENQIEDFAEDMAWAEEFLNNCVQCCNQDLGQFTLPKKYESLQESLLEQIRRHDQYVQSECSVYAEDVEECEYVEQKFDISESLSPVVDFPVIPESNESVII